LYLHLSNLQKNKAIVRSIFCAAFSLHCREVVLHSSIIADQWQYIAHAVGQTSKLHTEQ